MNDEIFFDRVDHIRVRLYKIAYTYLQSESMAVDAVDEAVYKGYVGKKRLREDRFMETWLVRILINVCKIQLGRSRRESCVEELSEQAGEDEYDGLPLKLAIQSLPEKYRVPVLLKYFGGYSTVEMAEILELPQGTVATRLRKALDLLRLEIEGDDGI